MMKRMMRWLPMLTAVALSAAAAAMEVETAEGKPDNFFAPGYDAGKELPAD